LPCIATAISKKAVVVERESLERHPATLFALIAASGERKSPSFSNMTRPLDKWPLDQQNQILNTFLFRACHLAGLFTKNFTQKS